MLYFDVNDVRRNERLSVYGVWRSSLCPGWLDGVLGFGVGGGGVVFTY